MSMPFKKKKEIKKSIRNRQGERRFPKKNNSFIFLSNRAKTQKVREIILFFPKPQNKYIILKDDRCHCNLDVLLLSLYN